MAEPDEEDFLLNASQSARDRRRAEQGQQHPLRYQFEGMYEGRPELSGTPDYNRNWLDANIPKVSRFRGHAKEPKKGREEERQGYEAGRGFTLNVNSFDMSQDRSVNTTNNNYMGEGNNDDGGWGKPGGEFEGVSFADMDHDLYNVRERGNGGWTSGELGSGMQALDPGDSSGALGI